MSRKPTIAEPYAGLLRFYGSWATVREACGITAETFRRWAKGKQVPSAGKQAAAEALFETAGLTSPWPKAKAKPVQPAQPALFDLITFEPLVWGPLATAVIEDLADAAMCAYSMEEDRGQEVVLRSKFFSGGELVTWRVVRWATRSYALRLPDGRLLEYVPGSSQPLCVDTQARKDAREEIKAQGGLRGVA